MLETKYLQDSLENIQQLITLAPLKNFEIKSLKQLLRLSKIREYKDGEVIIREGDMDPWLYFLLSGKVRVSKEGVEISVLDKKGDVFGEMRILDGQDRSASVHAIGKTTCLATDTNATDRLSSRDDRANFLLLLYRMFTEFIVIRLRVTNEELVRAKKQIEILEDLA